MQSVAGQPEIILCIGFLETSLSENEGTGGVGGMVDATGAVVRWATAPGALHSNRSPLRTDGTYSVGSGPTGAVGLTRTVIVLDISLCGA